MNEPGRTRERRGKTHRSNRLLISILNWNGFDETVACVTSIADSVAANWDVLVIDSGSMPDRGMEFRQRFPDVEWLRLETNRGFTGGQNVGMRIAIERGYAAVLLLNNDCEIAPDAVSALFASLSADPLVAAVSPLIYRADARDRPQAVGGWLDWGRHVSARPSTPDVAAPAGMPTVVPGTALLLRCAALEQIGLLDDRYFAYYEDNDLCARIAAAGMKAIYCRSAHAWHDSRPVHAYSELALYLSARNAWLFWRRHTPARYRAGLYRNLLAQSLYEIAMLKKGNAHVKCAAVVAGFWDAQRGRSGPPPAAYDAPWLLQVAICAAPYLLFELLSNPRTALRSRVFRRPKAKKVGSNVHRH